MIDKLHITLQRISNCQVIHMMI